MVSWSFGFWIVERADAGGVMKWDGEMRGSTLMMVCNLNVYDVSWG